MRTVGARPLDRSTLLARYHEVRRTTERLCAPLAVEDYVVQAMPDVSPTKWHLAHVSWFFETFVLEPHLPGYRRFDPAYRVLFNSYYNAVGPQFSRPERGHLSRPTVAEVYAYRARVDRAMAALLERGARRALAALAAARRARAPPRAAAPGADPHRHQVQPRRQPAPPGLSPVTPPARARRRRALGWRRRAPAASAAIGHDGDGFAFDNERPRHRVLPARRTALADRARSPTASTSSSSTPAAIATAPLWLSEGWRDGAGARLARAALLGARATARWWTQTLRGLAAARPARAGRHVSYFEADAYARWRGARLPTEHEWEHAAADAPVRGNFQDTGVFHPAAGRGRRTALAQMFGDVWEWTQSAYAPYPGYRPAPGAVGEYNGKFMVNQMVLRGGSCATPAFAHPRDLPQLLPAGRPLAVLRHPAGRRRLTRAALPTAEPSSHVRYRSTSTRRRTRSKTMAEDVRRGLADASAPRCRRSTSTTPPARALFDEITRLPEYYPTRAEAALLDTLAPTLMRPLAPGDIVELGSGFSTKTRRLLAARAAAARRCATRPSTSTRRTLRGGGRAARCATIPALEVHAVVGDFERHLVHVPSAARPPPRRCSSAARSATSTRRRARGCSTQIRRLLRPRRRLLLGVDLVKDPRVLEAAYNDAAGVTARVQPQHPARRQPRARRRLPARGLPPPRLLQRRRRAASRCTWSPDAAADRRACGASTSPCACEPGESIWTESSYKFTRDSTRPCWRRPGSRSTTGTPTRRALRAGPRRAGPSPRRRRVRGDVCPSSARPTPGASTSTTT